MRTGAGRMSKRRRSARPSFDTSLAQQMARLERRIAGLRAEPTGYRLAIIVVDRMIQMQQLAIDAHPLRMTFVDVRRSGPPVKHGTRWIYGGSQRVTKYPIDESGPIAADVGGRSQTSNFRDQSVAQDVIGIQRENPLAVDMGETEIALRRRTIKIPPNDYRLRVLTNDFQRLDRCFRYR